MSAATYVLGHAPDELRRLDEQSAILRPATARLLAGCGLRAGMRALDVGCGTGEVTMLVAEAVGPAGSVTGVDRGPEALEVASDRAALRGADHVRFVEDDIATMAADEPFDAVVGRNVLMHQRDPAEVVAHLAGLTRPGAVMAFAEIAMVTRDISFPERPLLERMVGWIQAAMAGAGVNTRMGIALHDTFVRAGLPAPEIRLEPIAMVGADPADIRWGVETLRTLLPLLEPLGVTTVAEVGMATLCERLTAEAEAAGGGAVPVLLGTAWTRLPG